MSEITVPIEAIIGGFVGLTSLYGGLMWAFVKMLVSQMNRSLDERFQSLEEVWTAQRDGRDTLVDHRLMLLEGDQLRLSQQFEGLRSTTVDEDTFTEQIGAIEVKWDRLARKLMKHLEDHGHTG
jgi:hypothetical protein